ncbi:hypothetical protein L9F63_005871, partial [Diploptera punctata]
PLAAMCLRMTTMMSQPVRKDNKEFYSGTDIYNGCRPPKRNKRKNFEPRNISLYSGEDNEVSDKTGHENSVPPSSPPQGTLELGSNSKRSRKPVPLRRFQQSEMMSSAGAPMDLSCSRNENNDESCGEDCDEQVNSDSGSAGDITRKATASSRFSPSSVHRNDEQLSHYHHHLPQHGTDASAMKEYAENTMKELLSIYGLNSPDMAENITKNVPLDSFASVSFSAD